MQDVNVLDQLLPGAGAFYVMDRGYLYFERLFSASFRRQLLRAGETLFKWIKQHLRIKQFYGTTENAVKTQNWTAVSTYVLVAIVKKRLTVQASLYEILQIPSLTMFEHTPLDMQFSQIRPGPNDPNASNQMNFSNKVRTLLGPSLKSIAGRDGSARRRIASMIDI